MSKTEMLYVLCVVALALQITAISTEYWSVKKIADVKNGTISMGLWKACGDAWGSQGNISGDVNGCLHLPIDGWKSFPKNSLYTVRAFAIAGAVLTFIALACMYSGKKCAMMYLVLGGICSLVAASVWGAELMKVKISDSGPTVKFNPGYSFYMTLGSGLLVLLSAVLHHTGDMGYGY